MPNFNEQQYKEMRAKFEKYLDASRMALENVAMVAETGGNTYDDTKKTEEIEIQGKDPSGFNKTIDVSTPKAYIENLTNAMHEMLKNADSLTLEQKNENLESCMRTYMDQLKNFAQHLSTMEIAPQKEISISEENPLYQVLKNTIKDVPGTDSFLKQDVEFAESLMNEHARKCKEAYYRAMMKDPAFCQQAVKRAQNNLETLGESMPTSDSEKIKKAADTVQREADIVIIGIRIRAEQKNAEIYYDTKIQACAREMCRPNPIFDPRAEEDAKSEYQMNSYANDILRAAHAQKEFSAELMSAGFNIAMPRQMYERLGKTGLSPKSKEGAETRNQIHALGTSRNIEVTKDDLKALSGTGSDEYTSLHTAYAKYLYQQRRPGKSMTQEENTLYENSMDYLFKKKSRPITQDGKDRVEGAVKLFTTLSLQKLNKMPNKSDEREKVIAALKLEMLRNPTCRRIVNEELVKEGSKVAKAVSDDLRKFSDEVGNYTDEHGIALHGKIEHPRKALAAVAAGKSVEEALNVMNGRAPAAPQNSISM